MKRKILTACSVFSLMATALPVVAQDQNQNQDPSQGQNQNQNQSQQGQMPQTVMVAENVSMEATVQSVDQQKHVVTLKDTQGNEFHVKVSPKMKNISQLKPGDQVLADVYESTALSVRKPGEPVSNQASQQMMTLPPQEPGASPTRVLVNTTQVTATIENIDRQNRTVTLKGPEGKTMHVKLAQNGSEIKQLKPGDQVVADITDAVGISIVPKGQNEGQQQGGAQGGQQGQPGQQQGGQQGGQQQQQQQ